MTAADQASSREARSVAVVGGGIGGLYAAYLLGKLGYDVHVFEVSDRWGGRIESKKYPINDEHSFIAEFGPMRFEAHLQERLRRLCFHLGVGFEPFSPTSAPVGTTHYDQTATESSLESPADLLKWAVLKMFFQGRVTDELNEIEREEEAAEEKRRHAGETDSARNETGPRQLGLLTRYMDENYFCQVKSNTVAALPDQQIRHNLDELRATATLRGEGDRRQLLAELGLWNALSEVISPGAIARIRDSGTFYHFIAQNPSALEWGIFWLRQASVMGDLFRFDHNEAPNGTYTLVELLRAEIETLANVHLNLGHEVVGIGHGKRSNEVVLSIVCDEGKDGRYSFSQLADDVVLALPRLPLARLAEQFPADVRKRVESVVGMPLLKAFLIKRDPWWRYHLKAQSFAWLVPTRELHYFRPSSPRCPIVKPGNARLPSNDDLSACTCEDKLDPLAKDIGMIMLYTDEPAIKYWQALIPSEKPSQTCWAEDADGAKFVAEVRHHPDKLLATLIRRLLMIPDPGLAREINVRESVIIEQIGKIDQALADAVTRAPEITGAPEGTGKLAERIFDATDKDQQARKIVEGVLREEPIALDLDPEWHNWLKLAIKAASFNLDVKKETKKLANDVRAYGIRDWSAAPFGGASHVWLPGADGREATRDPLIAFSLRGRTGEAYKPNLHICGEAYSGFQGFIEGALRTAEQVVDAIAGPDAAQKLFDKELAPGARAKEKKWQEDQPVELTKNWEALP